MLETLHPLSRKNAERAAAQLARGEHVGIRVDPVGEGTFLILTPGKPEPCSVDFVLVRPRPGAPPDALGMAAWDPAPMTGAEHAKLKRWADDAVPRICRIWRRLSTSQAEA